jgi:hypothetical protein
MAGRKDVNDLARSIGLYDGSATGPLQQPLTGPHTRSALSASAQQPPPQPLSAPHPSLGLPPDPYAAAERPRSGGRYVSNPTREAIAQLIEGTEARSSRNSAGSARSSLHSQQSAASFDPSTVDGERSWDSAGSYVRPNSAASSGRSGTSGVLFPQPSADSLQVEARQGAVRTQPYGDDVLREQLPLELRSFGAPPEYAQVMRSPPSSQPGSSVQLGVTPVAERYRRSDAGQLATPPQSAPSHQRPPMSHGSLHEEQVLAAIMQSSALAEATPSSARNLHLDFGAASTDSPRSSGRSGTDVESGHSESMGGGGGDDSDPQKKHILSDAVIRKLKLKNQQLEKELRDKKKQLEEMTKSIVSWKKR